MSKSVDILQVTVDDLTLSEAAAEIEKMTTEDKSSLVVTPNPEMIMLAQKDDQLREILNAADLSLPDGSGVVWAARLLGEPLTERVAGIDLVWELLARGDKQGYNFYFLGAAPGVAKQAKQRVKQKYPELTVYAHHGYLDRKSEYKVVQEIKNREIDILLVGMGVPLQEKWLAAYIEETAVPVGIGVGGTFDILAGKKQRAPKLMQRLNLEWLYRLYQEPKRWRRMMKLPFFIYYVCLQKLKYG